jgi:hypothetical protein
MGKNGGLRPGSGRKKLEYWRITFGVDATQSDGEVYIRAGGSAADVRVKAQKMLDDWPIKNLGERYQILDIFQIKIFSL